MWYILFKHYEHTTSRSLCKIKFDLNENLSWPLYGRRRRTRRKKRSRRVRTEEEGEEEEDGEEGEGW